MKNPLEVLRAKEQELQKVKREVDALRLTIQLMGEENQANPRPKNDPRSLVDMP